MSSTEVQGSARTIGNRSGGPSRRLDMRHGFLQYIWRNQIDRDEFHKVQEQRKTDIKKKLSDRRKSSTDGSDGGGQQLYVPPALRKQNSEANDSGYESKSSDGCPLSPDCFESDSLDDNTDNKDATKPALRFRESNENKPRPSSQIIDEQEKAEKVIRENVRRRYFRTVADVDDLCVSLSNSSILDNEREETKPIENDTLFTLQLSLKNGENVAIDVPERTQAARLAKSLSREYEFNDEQCRKLRIFIEDQLEQRISSKQNQSELGASSD